MKQFIYLAAAAVALAVALADANSHAAINKQETYVVKLPKPMIPVKEVLNDGRPINYDDPNMMNDGREPMGMKKDPQGNLRDFIVKNGVRPCLNKRCTK